MSVARLIIFGPIPHPSQWLVAADETPPPGHLKLASLSLASRTAANPGSELVPVAALPSQIERLLRAYALLDAAGRGEVLRMAEQLAGIA